MTEGRTEHKTVDFQLSRDAKVRVMALPVRFDDEGKIKAYTEEEKKCFRATIPKLPGYEAILPRRGDEGRQAADRLDEGDRAGSGLHRLDVRVAFRAPGPRRRWRGSG